MKTRVAVIAIIIEDNRASQKINMLLHQAAPYIIGRMGIPYPKRDIAIMSVAVDAPQAVISALSGKLGQIHGVSTKTAYSNVITDDNGETVC